MFEKMPMRQVGFEELEFFFAIAVNFFVYLLILHFEYILNLLETGAEPEACNRARGQLNPLG